MATYEEERLYNELMGNAPASEQSTATAESESALRAAENAGVSSYSPGRADALLDEAINKYLSGRGFDYNTADDPDYQAYVREYQANAKKGSEISKSTAGRLANGYNPTYSDAVADEVYNSQMENVTNAIPQFKSVAAMENAGRQQQLANAVNIYSNQSQRDYGRYRDIVGDKKNFLNYLYNRYAVDRQSDVQQNANNASLYGTRLSAAQSNLENARSIDNQRYFYGTQSADSKAKLAQQERENLQKIEYQRAEDAYNEKVEKAKEEQEYIDKEKDRIVKPNATRYIEAYNLDSASNEFITKQLAIGRYKGHISNGEAAYICKKLGVKTEDVAEMMDLYEKNGGSFERRNGSARYN